MVLLKRIIVISMLALLLGTMVMNFSVTYAAGPGGWKGNINNGQKAISSTKSFLSNVLGVVRTVGMIIAVVILIVIACKYIFIWIIYYFTIFIVIIVSYFIIS